MDSEAWQAMAHRVTKRGGRGLGSGKESGATEQLTDIIHNKYHVLELSWNHSPQLWVMKELFSMKLIPGAKKAVDHWPRWPIVPSKSSFKLLKQWGDWGQEEKAAINNNGSYYFLFWSVSGWSLSYSTELHQINSRHTVFEQLQDTKRSS